MPKGSPISTSEYFTMSDLWEKCHVKQPCFIVKLRKCSDDCACFITRHALYVFVVAYINYSTACHIVPGYVCVIHYRSPFYLICRLAVDQAMSYR